MKTMKKLGAVLLTIGIAGSIVSLPVHAVETANLYDDEDASYYSGAQVLAADEDVDPETGFRPDRVYYIRNVRSGLYLNTYNGGASNGVHIVQNQYQEQKSQQWHIYKDSSGYYQISPLHAHSRNMGIGYDVDLDETEITLWNRNISFDQWSIEKNTNRTDRSYRIISKRSGKSMAILGASYAENACLVQSDYTNDGIRNDEWIFEPVMETEIYYDTGFLHKNNFTASQAENQIRTTFMEVADCFYQKFGIRYQTPKVYKNITEADKCGTAWNEACPHTENHKYPGSQLPSLISNLSGHTFRIQISGHYHKNILGVAYKDYPVFSGRAGDNRILFAHEMTHTFDIGHHDNKGGTDVMNKPNHTDAQIWAMRPNLWDDACQATIIKNSARFATYQDTTYPNSNTYTIDRNTMEYIIADIPKNTTAGTFRNNINFKSSYTILSVKSTTLYENSIITTGCTITSDGYTYKLVVRGDIDGDGSVNIADVQELTKINARIGSGIPPTYWELKIGDIDQDGSINIADVQELTKMIAQGV